MKVAPSSGGNAEIAPGFVTALGSAWVVREPTGRLVLREGKNTTELASAKCAAKIAHADAERRLLLIACTGPKGRPALSLVGPGFAKDLGIDVSSMSHDHAPGAPSRLVALYPGNDAVLLDLETKKLVTLGSGDHVIVTFGSRALVRRGKALLLEDVDAKDKTLSGETTPLADTLSNGSIGVSAPWVVDLARGESLGRIQARPLAVAPDGHVLVAANGDADAEHLAQGPLRWKAPESD